MDLLLPTAIPHDIGDRDQVDAVPICLLMNMGIMADRARFCREMSETVKTHQQLVTTRSAATCASFHSPSFEHPRERVVVVAPYASMREQHDQRQG